MVHDSGNALAGATAGQQGIIVIAGTGSVARGIKARGEETRVGGWGHQFDDKGSAYWIGRGAVRSTLAEYNRAGPKAVLTPMLFGRLSVGSAYGLMARYYSGEFSRNHPAGLATWANKAADSGDGVARGILRKAGVKLAEFALQIISPFFTQKADTWNASGLFVCYTGGVFGSEHVLSSFTENVRRNHPEAKVRPALLLPVFGSLLLAYRGVGAMIPPEVCTQWVVPESNFET